MLQVGSRIGSSICCKGGLKDMDSDQQGDRCRRRGSPTLFSWRSQVWEYRLGSLSNPVPKDTWETLVGSCEATGGGGGGAGEQAGALGPSPALPAQLLHWLQGASSSAP